MSQWVTVAELRMYLDQVPLGAEEDAALQAVLDRAEALIGRYLTGVVIAPPAPDDLKQVELELASSIYLTKGTASLLETAGAEGQGDFRYVGYLTQQQRAALLQIRIEQSQVAF
jgi:hypothetical protein